MMRDVDDGVPVARTILKKLYPYTGRAHVVGVTGSPGSGKSTIVDQLIAEARKQGRSVGVVAIDPTSPFSEGAILGDRIRMLRHSKDNAVFIRSVATRGDQGGLSRSTSDIVDIMDAMGKDVIMVETVGVGQVEVDIMRLAHTIVVVLVPEMGDDIQAIKAGLLEIGDIFVVNKADLKGADATINDITMMLESKAHVDRRWHPLVTKTVATKGSGIQELETAIARHRSYLADDAGETASRQRIIEKFNRILREILFREVLDKVKRNHLCPGLMEKLIGREIDPYSAAETVLQEWIAGASKSRINSGEIPEDPDT